MVVVEEVVLAHGLHIGADSLPGTHSELLEGDAFPLRGRLHDLSVDGVLLVIIRDVKLNRCAGSVAVQVVVDPTLGIHDQRNLNHRQVQFLAEVLLDVTLHRKQRLHGLLGGQPRSVVRGKELHQFFVTTDARHGKVCLLVRHGAFPPF